MIDPKEVIAAYLLGQPPLTDIVGTRIYGNVNLPEDVTLPCINFFSSGGFASGEIPPIRRPSIQFDCWGESIEDANDVYLALYSILHGLRNVQVTTGGSTYFIHWAEVEVEGQDIIESDMPNNQEWHRMTTFIKFVMKKKEN